MNKNIRNMSELHAETERLKTLSNSQWKQLSYDLSEIREAFKPGNLLRKMWTFTQSRFMS